MRNIVAIFLIGIGMLLFFPHWGGSQWVQTGGPEGGAVFDLVVTDRSLFAVIGGRSIYRSRDSGKSWESVGLAFSKGTRKILDLAFFEGTLFMVFGDAGYKTGYAERPEPIPPAVFTSSNDGNSWQAAPSRLPNEGLAYFFGSTRGILFARAGSGFYTLSNNGATWRTVNAGLRKGYDVNCLASNDQFIFIGTTCSGVTRLRSSNWDTGLFVSSDNGKIWKPANSGLPSKSDVVCLAANRANLFASIDEHVFGEWDSFLGEKIYRVFPSSKKRSRGVFKSADSGANWKEANAGLPEDTYVYCLIPKGQKIFAGTWWQGVYRSVDNGANWTVSDSGLPKEARISNLAEDGKNLFAGTYDHGLYVSGDDGESWTGANSGLVHSDVCALATDGSTLLVGTYGGDFVSTNNGGSYKAVDTKLAKGMTVCLVSNGKDFFAGTSAGVFASADGKAKWIPINSGLPEDRHVNCLAVEGKVILAGIGNRIFLSADKGAAWMPTSSPLPRNAAVLDLLVVGSTLFAGTSEGLFWSADDGANWKTTVRASFPARARVQALAQLGSDLFVGTRRSGVFRSSDGGISWSDVNAGLPKDVDVRILLTAGPDLFGVMDEGVFNFREGSTGWTAINSGLPREYVVQCLAENGGNLFAGTDGGGVWRLLLSDLSSKK